MLFNSVVIMQLLVLISFLVILTPSGRRQAPLRYSQPLTPYFYVNPHWILYRLPSLSLGLQDVLCVITSHPLLRSLETFRMVRIEKLKTWRPQLVCRRRAKPCWRWEVECTSINRHNNPATKCPNMRLHLVSLLCTEFFQVWCTFL
jgi:hypothetical protein